MAGVTLRRASAGVQSLCFLPPSSGRTQHDVWRRLTPIRRRSQRLNIFFVFNHRPRMPVVRGITYCSARLFSRPCDSARSLVPVPHRAIPASRKCRDELQRHHVGRCDGAIYSGNMGASAEDPPTAIPARSRHDTNDVKLHAREQLSAEITWRRSTTRRMLRLPWRSTRSPTMLLRTMCSAAQRNRRSEIGRRERKKFAQRVRDAGDDGRVEAEQKFRRGLR